MGRNISNITVLGLLLIASLTVQADQSTQAPAAGLATQWKNVQALSGRILTRGVQGFSTDINAAPPHLTVKANVKNGQITRVAEISTDDLPPSTITEWQEDDSGKFYVKWEESFPHPGDASTEVPYKTLISSWDGQRYSMFRRSSSESQSTIYFQKGMPDQIDAFATETFLTNPFRFLSPTALGKSMTQLPSLKILKDPATYARFLQSAKSLGFKSLLNKRYLAFDIDGGVDPFTGRLLNYRVYLDPDRQFYPIAWDKTDKNSSALLEEYRIDALALETLVTGETFYYPKSATTTFYLPTSPLGKPVVNAKYEVQIDSLKVNQPKESDYSIDPSIADLIIDNDTGTVIEVPK